MTAILAARSLTKRFPGVTALDGVSFDLRRGEIHALCGENGAGKSTLIKLLGGIYAHGSYEGELLLEGVEAGFRGPADAEASGIAVIHQELALVPELSAAENLFLGRLPRRGMRIDWTRMFAEAAACFAKLGVAIAPEAPVAQLGIAQRQMLEIARALSKQTRILILDEPTAALSEHETQTLLALLRELRGRGVSSVYISHRLEEVFAIADRISVLRDGRSVFCADARDTDRQTLIRHMAGREIQTLETEHATPEAVGVGAAVEPLLRLEGLSVCDPLASAQESPFLQDISLTLARGEILGIGGLMGAGRTSLLMHLAGAWGRRVAGSVRLEGAPLDELAPSRVLKRGLALVSEDRRRFGFIGEQSIGFNLSLSSLGAIARGGRIRPELEGARNTVMFRSLGIRAPGLETPTRLLSGGNQQKNVLGRVLLSEPKVILLDEPTRGIDVGAKAEIYAIIRELAQRGAGVLLVSSELPELTGLSDRILMLREGRMSGVFPRATSHETLLAAAMGHSVV